jgi:hypothetical protein
VVEAKYRYDDVWVSASSIKELNKLTLVAEVVEG